MTYYFDEEELRYKLSGIGKRSQAIFAASCATRLMPRYEEYKNRISLNKIEEDPIIKGLSYLWDNTIKGHNGLSDIDDIISSCEASLPDEDNACDIGSPYAADAAAAAYYALCVYKSDSVQNAIWSARRVYEALDNYVTNKFSFDPSTLEGEKKVLEHPLVQKELLRQNRDIQEIVSVGDSINEEIAKQFYSRAISEADDIFGE